MSVKKIIPFLGTIYCIFISVSFVQKSKKVTVFQQVTNDSKLQKIPKTYTNLSFVKTENLTAAAGTKSVIFNHSGTTLYAMNLEGMSIYEFDEKTRKNTRIIKFKPTKATGWDYALHKSIPSFEEKPVEACFSNNDDILWVSLHNAHGVVPIHLKQLKQKVSADFLRKKIYIKDKINETIDSAFVPFIKTGKTPKVIAKTADSKYVLVSNWHSNNVSVIATNDSIPYGKVIATIPVSAIPRGIVVDDVNQKSYIAIMGGKTISVVNNNTWKIEKELKVASTPRHIVMDNQQRIFVSYNSLGKIACINPSTGETLFSAKTNAQPRTIMLSKNQQFLFVTCYSGNTVDVFKINNNSFTQLYSLECKGKPVGVDIYEDDAKLEAWVCNYVGGNIKVFTFEKK
jgi:YVTN family beta-propeller protein